MSGSKHDRSSNVSDFRNADGGVPIRVVKIGLERREVRVVITPVRRRLTGTIQFLYLASWTVPNVFVLDVRVKNIVPEHV